MSYRVVYAIENRCSEHQRLRVRVSKAYALA